MLRDDTWDFLHALPASDRRVWAGRVLAVHHGSPASDTEYVTPYKPFPASVEQFWAAGAAEVLILGHTHIPMIDRGPAARSSTPARSWVFPASRPRTASPWSTLRAWRFGSSTSVPAARSAAIPSPWTRNSRVRHPLRKTRCASALLETRSEPMDLLLVRKTCIVSDKGR